jgi:hypothetical protein
MKHPSSSDHSTIFKYLEASVITDLLYGESYRSFLVCLGIIAFLACYGHGFGRFGVDKVAVTTFTTSVLKSRLPQISDQLSDLSRHSFWAPSFTSLGTAT